MNQKRRKMCSGGESVVVEVAMYVCHTQAVLASCSCAGVVMMVFCAPHRCELSLIVNPRACIHVSQVHSYNTLCAHLQSVRVADL